MASEQNLQMQFESVGDPSLEQKLKSVPSPATASEIVNGCFDCNICLDSAHDPVVTLCGHLYCWPCIYKWLHVQTSSPESENQPNCPVCKDSISKASLVPLYGRGNSQSECDAKRPQLNQVIPCRPPAIRSNTSLPHQQISPNLFLPHQQYFPHPLGNYGSISQPNFVATAMMSPTVGMFGEMVFARMFGDTSLFSSPHTNYYALMGNGGLRVRRQELQAEKSLNRVTIFLMCCLILCLLLF